MPRKLLSWLLFPLLLLLGNSSGNSAPRSAERAPEGFNPGPDAIAGNMDGLYQDGAAGTQRGLAVGITTCNAGNVVVNFFAMPSTNHPAVAQDLYRMSGGSSNTDRFEQIGQSWVKHTYGAKQADSCGFGCQPGGNFTHLGVGCSDTYFASQSAEQSDLGSRAWINPFTGIFPTTARDHTGHVHTGTSHKILVESNDLNTTLNPGATYYAELLYVTSDEYAWCQSHPGECNMYNNASYRRYNVSGTTNFTFAQVGATVRMTPAIYAWTGATINPVEPDPGNDGRAFLAFKVTNPSAGVWHYEYALYNQNLDRAIQSFSVPLGCTIPLSNLGFHAPLNHPGFPNDGTQGDAGFSNAPWTSSQTTGAVTWSTETFAQNQNANAIRWGTLYNFRFDSDKPPVATNATIGFFKTGAPITVAILGPNACDGSPTPTPTATPCPGTAFIENFDGVVPPALPPGWSSTTWVTSALNPDTAPNDVFVDDPAISSDKVLFPPPLTVTSALAQVSFRNNYDLEASGGLFFDGGVLEVSSPNINGGVFTDVTDPAVGGSFASGGYSGVITDTGTSAIAGRAAWSGNSGGYVDTVLDLGPNLDGQPIQFRFRMVSDGQGAGVGWRMDTFTSVGVCVGPIPTPTPPTSTPTPTPPGPTPTATATPPATATPTPSATPVASSTPIAGAQALNLSTRMRVQTGGNVGIGGFIIRGSQAKRVLIRAIGPSLAQLGVPDVLADPVLQLYGNGSFIITSNDNWRDYPDHGAAIIATGIPPTNDLESAILETLNTYPSAYTAVVSGNNSTSGVGLVEVYDLDPTGDSQLANISTRAFVDTGDNIVILGFVLGNNSGAGRVVLRGIGPSLPSSLVPNNRLADPTLELRDGNGALLRANNDWQDDPLQASEIAFVGLAPNDPLESGIAATLPPGLYTALLAGLNNGTGTGLVEVYDLGAP